MIYLALSIVTSTLIFVLFKLFGKYNVNRLQAIVFNYLAAGILGILVYPPEHGLSTFTEPWIVPALFLGVLFISIFLLMAKSSHELGVAVTSVATKMSVLVPISLAFILYNDTINSFKFGGIALAIIGILLTFYRKNNPFPKHHIGLALGVFFGSGIIDSTIKYAQVNYLSASNESLFVATIFLISFFIGLTVIAIKQGLSAIKLKSVYWGIALGIPNFGSMYYLVKALSFNNLESSIVFPINNMGIVLLSALVSALFFKEQFTKTNVIGIVSSLIAILLIGLA